MNFFSIIFKCFLLFFLRKIIDCVNVLVSQISVLHFQAPPNLKLSANFAQFQKPQSFAVVNNKGK